MVKRVWIEDASGVRPRERPKIRWMNGVERALDARGVTVEQGRESARDRGEWRRIVSEFVKDTAQGDFPHTASSM